MRILYGRDYYDSALAFGHDDNITFIRERDHYCDSKFVQSGGIAEPTLDLRLHPTKRNAFRSLYGFTHRAFQIYEGKTLVTFYLMPCKVVVCAKSFQGMQIYRSDTDKSEFYWTKDTLYQWFAEHNIRPEIWSYSSFKGHDQFADATVTKFFEPNDVSKDTLAWLVNNKITILTNKPTLHGEKQWRINGDDLKDFQFYKVRDPYTLFQEISMWVGGILPGSANPMVQITDDNIKVAKHGFDPKWSFRKQGKSSNI
jgi:hypothetical protein